VEGVRLGRLLHLKTGVSALADGTLLLAGRPHPPFDQYLTSVLPGPNGVVSVGSSRRRQGRAAAFPI
jgi:hypothetical protein